MAKIVAFMVRVKVHDVVEVEDVKQILQGRLDGIGQGLDINCQYILPDAVAARENDGGD